MGLNRTYEEALDFARKQPPSKALSGLIAEILVHTGNEEEAITRLSKVSSEVGLERSHLHKKLKRLGVQYDG